MFLLSQSEREDFEELIRNAGFVVEDFELIGNEEQSTTSESFAIHGIIIIRRKSNGIKRQYNTSHIDPWLALVEDDLLNGEFGNP